MNTKRPFLCIYKLTKNQVDASIIDNSYFKYCVGMNLEHNFWVFEEAIPGNICDKIILTGESEIRNGKGLSGTTGGNCSINNGNRKKPLNEKTYAEIADAGENEEDYYVRDSEVTWLVHKWLYDLVTPYVFAANENAGWHWDIDLFEDIQYTKYENSGFYGWHNDGGSDHHAKYKRKIYGVTPDEDQYVRFDSHIGKVRKISVTVNLSDGNSYVGGDLKLDNSVDGIRNVVTDDVFRKKGTVIVFPSFLPHCVTPVTEGVRRSLVMWSLGNPWK